MSRSFESSVDFPVSVEQVFLAFCAEDYWHARVAAAQSDTAALDSLIVEADNAVTATTSASLLGDRLPKLVKKVVRGDLGFVQTQKWSRIDGDRVRGEIDIAVSGVPATALGEGLLVAVGNGSRLDLTATVEVKVPLVGGGLERLVGGLLGNDLKALQQFTTEWIAENR